MKNVLLTALLVLLVAPFSLMAELKKAPDFSLPNEQGVMVSLKDYAGKIVVLEWTNPDCPFVKRHYSQGTMKSLDSKYSTKEVVWLAVNSTHYSTAEQNMKWKDTQGFKYPVLLDSDGTVGKLYGARTTPHLFVIDKEGNIAYSGAIDDDSEGSSAQKQVYVDIVLNDLINGRTTTVQNNMPYGCSVKYKG